MQEDITHIARGTKLEGRIYDPNTSTRGTIGLFSPGWAAHFEDYHPLLIPLSQEYRVIAFNLRGHGKSEGTLDEKECIEDLVEIYERFAEGNVAVLGHSLSSLSIEVARRTNPGAVVLFNPYISSANLPGVFRGAVNILRRIPSATRGIDAVLNPALYGWDRLAQKTGRFRNPFHMKNILRNTAALQGFDVTKFSQIDTPLLYFVAGKDTTLGTHKERRRQGYRLFIGSLSAQSEDASGLADDLNHCMNKKRLAPFLRDEPGRSKKEILDRVLGFLERNMQK